MPGRGSCRIRACHSCAHDHRGEPASIERRAGLEAQQSPFATPFTSRQAEVVCSVARSPETTTEGAAMRSQDSRAATAGQSMNLKENSAGQGWICLQEQFWALEAGRTNYEGGENLAELEADYIVAGITVAFNLPLKSIGWLYCGCLSCFVYWSFVIE